MLRTAIHSLATCAAAFTGAAGTRGTAEPSVALINELEPGETPAAGDGTFRPDARL